MTDLTSLSLPGLIELELKESEVLRARRGLASVESDRFEHLIHIPSTRVVDVTRTLAAIDMELRRGARLIQHGYSPPWQRMAEQSDLLWRWPDPDIPSAPRPLSPSTGGMHVLRAEQGSLEAFLEPYGLVRDALLSDPLQLALTVQSVWANVRRVASILNGTLILDSRSTRVRSLAGRVATKGLPDGSKYVHRTYDRNGNLRSETIIEIGNRPRDEFENLDWTDDYPQFLEEDEDDKPEDAK